MKHIVTNQSITITVDGETHTVRKGAVNFEKLRQAIQDEDWGGVPSCLTVAKSIKEWAQGEFTIVGGEVHYRGEALPTELNGRIVQTATEGGDPTFLMRFWEKLSCNPSYRSVQQLYPFLDHKGIPINEAGNFLAYKGVNTNLTDCHTGRIDNSPGTIHKMPRNRISDDPREACHYGFHVGAIGYARSFGSKVVIVEVNPEHVVCVPYDHSHQKMRVCEYKVTGFFGDQLPDSTYVEEDRVDEDGDGFEVEGVGDALAGAPKTKQKLSRAKSGFDPRGEEQSRVWDEMDQMDVVALMDHNLGDLRRYATYRIHIVGASKIRGGKRVLVERIIEVRN